MNLSRSSVAIAAGATFLSGCAVSLNLPANRFESPATQGGSSMYLEAGLEGANKVVLVPLTTADPPELNAPFIERACSGAVAGAGFGCSPEWR